MRFLITSAPDASRPQTAPSAPPSEQVIAAYMKYNEDLHRAGVLVASEGLSPASKPARVGVSRGRRVVLDGPFVETKELVGGFYLIDVKSRDEAIEWALKCPVGFADVLTIHQLTEAGDLPPEVLKIIDESAPTWSKAFRKEK